MLKSRKIVSRDRKIISSSLTREYELVIERGKGCFVFDADGKKYLDFAAGVAVMGIGYSNPFVLQAVKGQMQKGFHAAFSDYYSEVPVKFCENLKSVLPKSLNNFFLSNSGTEAVEAAFKCAKWHSRKRWTLAFNNCFHGRTMGALSMTCSKEVQRKRFEPFLPVKHSPYAYCYRCGFGKSFGECSFECLDAFEKTLKSTKGNCSAVFIEPIQGEGGYIVPPKEFLQGIEKICREKNVLLAADEVQAGCFRTGSFLASQAFNIKPDIACLGKGIASGMPIGVTAANKKTMDWVPGSHANTFGGNLLACASGIATLEYMKAHRLGRNAERMGKHMMKQLQELLEMPLVGDVRGKGLMIGVELVKDKKTKKPAEKERKKILLTCLKKGLVLLPCGASSVRFCPPLTISKELAEKGINIFGNALKLSAR